MNEFTIPLRTTTGLNAREHWRVRAQRVKQERAETFRRFLDAVTFAQRQALTAHLATANTVRVTLTRVSPRRCDSDNLQGGLKAVRDEVAYVLGIDDGDDRMAWEYAQERGPFAVRVRIEALAEEVAA